MTVNAILAVEESAPETARALLGAMLEKGVVDALLVPWQLPAGDSVHIRNDVQAVLFAPA